jgi:hypothetical protein
MPDCCHKKEDRRCYHHDAYDGQRGCALRPLCHAAEINGSELPAQRVQPALHMPAAYFRK